MRAIFLFFITLCLPVGVVFSQIPTRSGTTERPFLLKGKVIDENTNGPVDKVNIEITGGAYTTTSGLGLFEIKARIGDELIVKSEAFETVYYYIKDEQFITIKVEKETREQAPVATSYKRNANKDLFNVYIDSSRAFLKRDAGKSIEYVTKALESVGGPKATDTQNAIVFETLGDINMYWEQYDLAIDNYKRSISSRLKTATRIKLASAYRKNKSYQESISAYTSLLNVTLTDYQKILVYEGLGDTHKAINDTEKSVTNYEKALFLSKAGSVAPKITDLNSKIGAVYAQSGAKAKAEVYFDNSLGLSKKENKQRAVEEKNTVADFYNQNRDFDKEIELRSEALEELKSMEGKKLKEDVNSALTPQRQNYKIADAFLGKMEYKEAIPYLEKSISEADANEDLVVEKDARRKLSEVYKDIGEFDKAAESYERYVEVVDELYIKKDQEISQATRFSKEIALRQNRITSLENERKLNESRYQLAFENQELIEKNNLVQKWVIGSLILIALLLLYTAYNQYKSVKRQKYANNLLALKGLRTQMNPHFIFNALNSVNSFIATNDERAANKYLSEFSQLMRSVLENSEEDFIPLSKEIELLELYVKLEHFRFQDKFDYSITVSEAIKVNEFVIPPMLLQPYVENAVWHGLRYKEEKGFLEIDFQQIDSETIQITITDNGIGRKQSKALKTENQKKQKSKGMGNIQKRIAILNDMYKDKVDVTITDVSEDTAGTRVQLTLKKD
ncbi:tetratricopeptide repeat-containing sensor histidine kinase [Cochleicola gelatinilyticus]|uniref:Histidine kinase n=1 Tax=Cochleicola gelatinilyticus TaxID=1763537 RepID=A0A167KCY9_9FLAO|nr:histidine kinase [Cochleicola gelatinilyticus]OAB81741.1 histidine kinase [Cochleicola gelatinilyticus]